jgi:hypothetical protein
MDSQLDQIIGLKKQISGEDKIKMRYKLLTWVCAHRHEQKGDKYLNEMKKLNIDPSKDFELVRGCFYNFS